jgi:hypothetical protein
MERLEVSRPHAFRLWFSELWKQFNHTGGCENGGSVFPKRWYIKRCHNPEDHKFNVITSAHNEEYYFPKSLTLFNEKTMLLMGIYLFEVSENTGYSLFMCAYVLEKGNKIKMNKCNSVNVVSNLSN